MTTKPNVLVVNVSSTTLPSIQARAFGFQMLLVTAAVLLPAASHWLDLPVRWLLPMHWPVILAGLAYGPIGGGIAGLLAPPVSFSLSGMPPISSVPVMMTELFAYGVLTGLLRGTLRWNAYAGIAVALLAGRLLAIAITLFSGVPTGIVAVAYAKGLLAALAQIALLPAMAGWWIDHERGSMASQLARGRHPDEQRGSTKNQ